MTAQVWRSADEMARFADLDHDEDDSDFTDVSSALHAGDRIGGPPVNLRGRTIRRNSVGLALILGSGWAALTYPELAFGWLPDITAITAPPTQTKAAETPTPAQAPPSIPPLASVEVASPPGTDPTAQATAPATETAADESAANATTPDPANAYAKRASAAGLHPGLSQVLLAKLSPADYANAAFAIKSALAQTSDTGVFVHPREHKGDVAVFEVRFVPGAETGCRRYVVEITKDRWLTTALPVENCTTPLKAPTVQ